MSAIAVTQVEVPSRFRLRGVVHRDPLLIASGVVCVMLIAAAVLAPVIAPFNPDQINIFGTNLGPSSAHLLGTDALGRDIFSRVLYGARLSLLGPAFVMLLSVSLGTALAIFSAWIGGRTDSTIARGLDVMFAFPGLLVAIIAVAILGQGLVAPVIALSLAYLPFVARVVRSVALRERHMAYIDACRSLGYSGWRICLRHIFPNVSLMVLAQATFLYASAITDLAAISFIGLGVQPPSSDWGLMVSDGSSALLNGHPMETLAAGGAIIIATLAFNVLGERLAKAFDVTR